MLNLVDLRFSKRPHTASDHITFSFSTFEYELITNQTSSTLLDETSAAKVQDFVDSLNGRIRPQAKQLRKLNLFVFLSLVILITLILLIFGSFKGSNPMYSAKVSAYTNGDNDQRASFILVLLSTFLGSVFYSFWSKYRIGKDIISIAAPVLERVRDSMRGLGLVIIMPDTTFFPNNIDITAVSPLSPKFAESDDGEQIPPKEVLYPGQKSEIEVVVHNKKKGLSGIISEEEDRNMKESSEDEANNSGADQIFFYSPVNSLQTPQFNKPISFPK